MTDVPEPTSTEDLPEIGPEAAAQRRTKRALWGVLAVIILGVGALAVRAADDDSAKVPVVLGSANEAGAAPAADMAMRAYVHYSAGPDLPELGGHDAAYRLAASPTKAQVVALAKALGLEGTPAHADGTWHLQDGDRALDVFEGAGARWSYSSGTDGKAGFATSSGSAVSPPCCAPIEVPETTTSSVPVDLPTKAEAKQIALDMLQGTGMDTDGAKVTVEGPYDVWSVTVTPSLHGLSAADLGANVSVGPKGVVRFASAMVGSPAGVGDVDFIGTAKAIDRLNDGASGYGVGYAQLDTSTRESSSAQGSTGDTCAKHADGSETCSGSACAGPADEPVPCTTPGSVVCPTDATALEGSTTTVVLAPDTPVASDDVSSTSVVEVGPSCGTVPVPTDPPEPIEVVLTDAHVVLMLLPASDGSNDGYLVPGYEFSSDDGGTVAQVAIAEDALAPVDPTPDPVPAPKCTPAEPDADGVIHEIYCDGPQPSTTLLGGVPGSSGSSGSPGSTPGSDPTMSIPPNESITPVEPDVPCTLPAPGPGGEVPAIACANPGDIPVQP